MSATRSVLIVEDDPALRRLLRSQLEAAGYKITEAPDGKSAISMLERHVPDLICLDLMLPELSGYSICEHVRGSDRLRHVPLLVTSARTLPEDRAQAEEAGASAFLTKPFTRQQLVKLVAELLSQRPPPAP